MAGDKDTRLPRLLCNGANGLDAGHPFSVISAVAARMADSCAMAATAKPSNINTSKANAPDRRVEIFRLFMDSRFQIKGIPCGHS